MSARLNSPHTSSQILVVLSAIHSCMHSPVTVRAKGDHVPWVVWSSVAQASDMMGLEIWQPISPQEWGRAAATLTVPASACDNVSCNVSASLDDRARRALTATGLWVGCFKSEGAKPIKIKIVSLILVKDIVLDVFHMAQFEDESAPDIAIMIRNRLEVVALVSHFAQEPEQAAFGSEEQEGIAVARMVQHPSISAIEAHIAALTLTEILEHPVGAISVIIPVSLSGLSGDYRHDAGLWRDDTTLPLASKAGMYVIATAINSITIETHCHAPVLPQAEQSPSSLDWQVRAA